MKRKRDVTDNDNDNDGDVKNESVGEKRDVITEEKEDAEKRDGKRRKKRKCDVTDSSDDEQPPVKVKRVEK